MHVLPPLKVQSPCGTTCLGRVRSSRGRAEGAEAGKRGRLAEVCEEKGAPSSRGAWRALRGAWLVF